MSEQTQKPATGGKIDPSKMKTPLIGEASYAQPGMSLEEALKRVAKRNHGLIASVLYQGVRKLQTDHGCLLAGPGRGDCEHFIGLPAKWNEDTTDVYGRPHGWCQVCWLSEKIRRALTWKDVYYSMERILMDFHQLLEGYRGKESKRLRERIMIAVEKDAEGGRAEMHQRIIDVEEENKQLRRQLEEARK